MATSTPAHLRFVPLVLAALLAGPRMTGLQAEAQPSFTVVSIHPSDPNAGHGMSISLNGDSLTAHNITLFMLIRDAYSLSEDQISGGPSWIASRRFDISAKTDTPLDPNLTPEAAHSQQIRMLQQLLTDRFQLRLRHETKDRPGYQMTVAKNGPHGIQADDGGNPGLSVTDGKLHATAITMDQLASVLEHVIESPVKNATGLSGKSDLDLKWDPAQTRNAAAADAPPTDAGPSIFVALQQQLGLRLEEHKTPADAVLIESAQVPQEN